MSDLDGSTTVWECHIFCFPARITLGDLVLSCFGGIQLTLAQNLKGHLSEVLGGRAGGLPKDPRLPQCAAPKTQLSCADAAFWVWLPFQWLTNVV